MLPLYATRIADLGQGDFVKVDCAACHHVRALGARPPRSPREDCQRPLMRGSGSHATRRWREMDSNPRSPVSGNTSQ